MAGVISLGVHSPSALPYLIGEGLLPPEPSQDSYIWETYDNRLEDVEEEVLRTDSTVVYSRDGYIHSSHHFHKPNQKVRFALLTSFAKSGHNSKDDSETEASLKNGVIQTNSANGRKHRISGFGSRAPPEPSPHSGRSSTARKTETSHADSALVIILAREAQIHFLAGPSYAVNVPFDVEQVFATPQGLLLQRKAETGIATALSPVRPPVPPNSFYASQAHLTPSFGSPQTPAKTQNQNRQSGTASGKAHDVLRALFQAPISETNETIPILYSLTDPLGDFCAVTHCTLATAPRRARSEVTDLIVEYDDLEKSDRVIYMSARDEVGREALNGSVPLLFLITYNEQQEQLIVWQGWYLKPQSLSSITALRAAFKTSRLQRRSSFATSVGGTGAGTPMTRQRDRARESFAASARLPNDAPSTRRKSSRQANKKSADDEDALATQMDPDFASSQEPGRSTRRISSLLSRGDLSTADPIRGHVGGTSGPLGGSRRGTSFGNSYDRRSVGTSIYRKSRGSTPGSAFSKSIGPDDSTMDVDVNDDDEEEIDRVQQLFLATQTSSGVEAAIGCASDGVKQELVLRKVYVHQLRSDSFSESGEAAEARSIKVCTLCRPASQDTDRQEVSVFVLNKYNHQLTEIDFSIARSIMILPNAAAVSGTGTSALMNIPVPLLSRSTQTHDCYDLAKVAQDSAEAVVYSDRSRSIQVISPTGCRWAVSLPEKARVYCPTDIRTALNQSKRDVGRRRLTEILADKVILLPAAPAGQIDLMGLDGLRHRVQILLGPRTKRISLALEALRFVLGKDKGAIVTKIWISALAFLTTESLCSAEPRTAEWQALIMTFFSFAVGSVGLDSIGQSKKTRAPRKRQSRKNQSTHQLLDGTSDSLTSNAWIWLDGSSRKASRPTKIRTSGRAAVTKETQRSQLHGSMTEWEARTRHFLHSMSDSDLQWLKSPDMVHERRLCTAKLMYTSQLLQEEWKLTALVDKALHDQIILLAAITAQYGTWLQLDLWDARHGGHYELQGATADWDFSDAVMTSSHFDYGLQDISPPSMLAELELTLGNEGRSAFPGLDQVAGLGESYVDPLLSSTVSEKLLPRSAALRKFITRLPTMRLCPETMIEEIKRCGLGGTVLESLPEAVAAPLREAIAKCQSQPLPTWDLETLRLVGREDLVSTNLVTQTSRTNHMSPRGYALRDIHVVSAQAEQNPPAAKSHEADRHAVIQQLFAEDRRYMEASRLTNPSALQVAECPPQPEWSEVEYLDQQKRVMQWVMSRTMAMSPGNAMVHFESQRPLLSEKFQVPGFSMMCQMKPMDNIISADRTGFTEEKLSWSFFHAGVSAGLHISHDAVGIDTSWIVFNKPADLTNRHAGFLFALGLNGHLKQLAKWLAFKYLTPKHTMTSVGLLLGLSASYLGSMDSLITRMLSVHIGRMLPVGAAELNVSSLTQTAGIMGVGLLYYNTQHRRMSEVMLSEVEHRDEDPETSPDTIKDESYRLAAGLALGFINLGKGGNIQGLHGMGLLERLLSVAVGSRPVEVVHVVDKAIAGAVIAIALVYLKTGDKTVARKIDVPDTLAQLHHVRPDILLLRSLAKNLILWDDITDEPGWIRRSLPHELTLQYFGRKDNGAEEMIRLPRLKSDDIPIFNIVTGLAWSLSLRYAGSGNVKARDEILVYLKLFTTISKQEAFYYDAMLSRNTVKRCVDLLALAAATVMAGTGDIETFRYLRRLHGRTDASTTFGSHLASHLAIGTLFLGGGTYTFGTSNLAIASLICAFYPLFPSDVLDNAVHLQALRHFWVFAAESRCVVVQDIDTQRPVPVKLQIKLRDGEVRTLKAPCLLPELDSIATLQTDDTSYWPVTLDFVANPKHLESFKQSQVLRVRSAPTHIASPLAFSSTLTLLNDAPSIPHRRQLWQWFLKLPAFADFEKSDLSLIVSSVANNSMHADERATVVDDQLALSRSTRSNSGNELWNLRVLFKWAEGAQGRVNGRVGWLGKDAVDKLRAEVERRVGEIGREEV